MQKLTLKHISAKSGSYPADVHAGDSRSVIRVTQLFSHTLSEETPLSSLSSQKILVLRIRHSPQKEKTLRRASKSRGRNGRFGPRFQVCIDTNGQVKSRKRKREGKRGKQNWRALYRTEGTNKTRLSVVSEYRG